MNLDQLRKLNYIIFESIVGSRAYGLDLPTSDTDYKGVFKLPLERVVLPRQPQQIDDDTNDTVFYEVGRYLDLLFASNPNILELLYVPDEFIITTSPTFDIIKQHRDKFLTTAIRNSLGGYAIAQIKKARGQNKKIVNPIDKERKTLLDFSFIITPVGAVPFREWLARQRGTQMRQEYYGAAKLSHTHNMYHIYYNEDMLYRGIIVDGANEVRLSSIPKTEILKSHVMYCNTEGYSTYCKDYKEYWEWVEKRNPVRYKTNETHGKGYDGKNLMHCFRLLEMGIEAAVTNTMTVKRPNRDWLLKVRNGDFEYKYLVDLAEKKIVEFDEAIAKSSLPTSFDRALMDDILTQIRFEK